MKSLRYAIGLLVLATACSQNDMMAPSADAPGLAISDAVHDQGNPHFFFLRPIVTSDPATGGTFDMARSPTVTICEFSGTACIGAPIAVFTRTSGPDGETVVIDSTTPRYRVNWHTQRFPIQTGKRYRISVTEATTLLGFVDVDVLDKVTGKIKNGRTDDIVPVDPNYMLQIAFRIEEGAISRPIVFTASRDGNEQIYRMDADGSNQVRLTNNGASETSPVWSPDGTKIVFVSNRSGNNDIWIMDANGSNQTQLTTAPAPDYTPGWSPDGSKIVFASQRDGNQELYIMAPDGSGQTNITNAPSLDYWPRWSPDGSKIAFSSDRGGSQDIWVMPAPGFSSPIAQLTTDPTIDYTPAWSPDGTRIAFATLRFGGQQIMIMNANGSGQTRITTGLATDFYPDFSADGLRILFSSNRLGSYKLFTINPDGSGLLQLPGSSGNDYAADWF